MADAAGDGRPRQGVTQRMKRRRCISATPATFIYYASGLSF